MAMRDSGDGPWLRWLIVVLCLPVVLAGVACELAWRESPGNETGTIVRVLGMIPDIEAASTDVWINDYARVREAYGIESPHSDADMENLMEYVLQLVGIPTPSKSEVDGPTGLGKPPFISGLDGYARQSNPNFGHLGFDARNVDQTGYSIRQGLGDLEIAVGRFDPEVTEESLTSCSGCEPHVATEYKAVSFYSWGDDFAGGGLRMRLALPAYDLVGRGGRIAVLPGVVLRTVETGAMRALIETHLEKRGSLGDVAALVRAGTVLDGLGVYAANLTDDVESLRISSYCESAELTDAQCGTVRERGTLTRYDGIGMGAGSDADGSFVAAALVYGDAAGAEANVAKLQQILRGLAPFEQLVPWRDMISELEVWSDGEVLACRFRPPRRYISVWTTFRDLSGHGPMFPYE